MLDSALGILLYFANFKFTFVWQRRVHHKRKNNDFQF